MTVDKHAERPMCPHCGKALGDINPPTSAKSVPCPHCRKLIVIDPAAEPLAVKKPRRMPGKKWVQPLD
jgi:endogenous inhibitor of DNA gyrase (YacG/DUF329 family)